MACDFISIDVGTGSAPDGTFDRAERMPATSKRDIALYRNEPGFAEVLQTAARTMRDLMQPARIHAASETATWPRT